MTAKELIAKYGHLPPDAMHLSAFLEYLGQNVPAARLANGARLCDATDFSAWLYELAHELQPGEFVELDKTCPRCGHLHEEDRECGFLIGGGRRCRCEMEVPA